MSDISTPSLLFIRATSNAVEKARSTLVFLDEKLPPSDILMISDKFLRILRDIDKSLSILNSSGSSMSNSYRDAMNRYASLRNTYIDRINERKANDVQLNTMAELYDGDNFISEINFRLIPEEIDQMKSSDIVIEIKEIQEPSQYSVLNIIERMTKTENVTLEYLRNCTDNLIKIMRSDIDRCRSATLNFKRIFESSKFATTMSTDVCTTECVSYVKTLQDAMYTIIRVLDELRKKTSSVFGAFMAMEKNYSIYKEAVETITSVALESIIGPGKLYEFM